jgi:PAS domain S-box-containing protein
MANLRNAPIKRKLMGIILLTTAMALLLAGSAIVILDTFLFRTAMQRDLTALASIVGDNSTAALAFNDPKVAEEILSALRARPHMVSACLYGPLGELFARYARAGASPQCPAPGVPEIRSTGDGLVITHEVRLDGRQIGTLVLLYDRNEVLERVQMYGAIVLVILLASSLIALVLSTRLQSLIAIPITRLASAARSVSESGDYGVRVQKDSDDELGLLVATFNDMLARIQTRDSEIQSARNSFQTTLASIGDAVISTDNQGRVVFANAVARRLLKWEDPGLGGKPIDEVFRIVNEYTRKEVESPVQRVLRDGTIAGLANHTVLIARDGTETPIDDSAAPIQQNGRTTGVVLVFRDISERRRALKDAAYLAAMVESSEDAIIGKSPDGVIQTWNSGAERLYGYPAAEVIGHPMRELLPVGRQDEETEILERVCGGGKVLHFETVRVKKDGTPIEVSLTISPIRDRAGEIVGVSHVARDITEQKRIAEQMRQTQKLESLGVLAGGIAHDFNNLLTGILGNASMVLEDMPADSEAREPIESVIAASERAAQLAQQMLAYSGKGRFVLETIDLSARVRGTLRLIKAAIPPTVELHLDLDDDLPAVEADGAQMQQLIMNIIINGAEAVPEGTRGTVTITTRREFLGDQEPRPREAGGAGELPEGNYVLLEVTDTGTGMDEETRARIFDPFFTTKFTGRGLGLAAVLGIVRGHRGSIQVISDLGKGTTFRVLLPATVAQEAKPAAQTPQIASVEGEGAVLVVDDEEIVRRLARQSLERHGYQVLLAENGARGLDMFARDGDEIRCVVLDLTMPVMSGEETLERMQAVRRDVPIILSSGFNEVQALQRFEGKGLAGFLQKPYRAGDLVEKVRAVMVRAGASREG